MGHLSKTCTPGIWKLIDDLWFDMGICLVLVSPSCTKLMYPVSVWTGMLMSKRLLLLCSHAYFPVKSGTEQCFLHSALNDSLKPELQVCLQLWGGIGAHSMDRKKPVVVPQCAGQSLSSAPDLGKAGGCSQCPAWVFCVGGLHTTSDGHIGMGFSYLQENLLPASSISQDLSLNCPGVLQTHRKTYCH